MSHERRVFVPFDSEVSVGAEILITDTDAHHLRTVVRISTGDPILVVDSNTGNEYDSFVSSTGSPFIVKIGAARDARRSIGSVSGLLFALCKNKTNEIVAEKATELGVDFIVFWEASRSIVKLGDVSERDKKATRLRKIAEEASKQSARNSIPEVYVVSGVDAALSVMHSRSQRGDRFFYGSLLPDARPFTKLAPLTTFAHVLIGPEGDLSPKEIERLNDASFESFTLGSNRLRAETAAFAAIAAIDIFGQLSQGRAE